MPHLRQQFAKHLFVVALLLPGISNATISFWDGYQLKEWSDAVDRIAHNTTNSTDFLNNGYFTGYIVGVAEMLDGLIICVPSGVKVGQLRGIVQKYIKANPEKWNRPAGELVLDALKPAFPCR